MGIDISIYTHRSVVQCNLVILSSIDSVNQSSISCYPFKYSQFPLIESLKV